MNSYFSINEGFISAWYYLIVRKRHFDSYLIYGFRVGYLLESTLWEASFDDSHLIFQEMVDLRLFLLLIICVISLIEY